MNIHEDLEWLSTTDMGQVKLKKNNEQKNTQWMSGLFVSQWLTRNGRAHSY